MLWAITIKQRAALHKEALDFRKRVLPADHPDIATSMGGLAEAYGALGDHKQSAALHKEALDFGKRVLPADHPDIATSMNNLVNAYFELGDMHAAELHAQEAVRILYSWPLLFYQIV